jgi:hypothetical protein
MVLTEGRTGLQEVLERLEPRLNRAWAIDRLNSLFAEGRTPESLDGFLPGGLVTPTLWGPTDAVGRRVTALYMPWLGKRFESSAESGINVLEANARLPMKVLWPSYEAEVVTEERIEAFRFATRVGPGVLDPDVNVLKIDYDSDANPGFIIRRILDELVQISDDLYLGKALYRTKKGWRPLLFFTLERTRV